MKNNIKKTVQLLIALSALLILNISCKRDYLMPWPPDGARQPSDVWNFYDYTKGFLDRIYARNLFTHRYNDIEDYGMLASACDEAMHSNSAGAVHNFVNGTWSPNNVPLFYFSGSGPYSGGNYRSHWSNSYIAIRIANIFLENVDNSVLIDDISNPARSHDRTYYKAQAYFLRAFFQFDLLKRYGPYPIITNSLSLNDDIFLPRNTMEECYNQIINDCDKAIADLPLLWDDNNWHRPNKTAAQALKSRVTLYYASPLYQGDFESFGIAANQTGDVNRWKDAISAAREAINDNHFYKLMPVTRFTAPFATNNTYGHQVFLLMGLGQTEYIWGTQSWHSNYNEYLNLPTGIEGCYGYTNPTQEIVDEFEVVKDFGKSNALAEKFDWNNPSHAENPYLNRDPRFYSSILYNGAVWGINSSLRYKIDTYEGGIHRDKLDPNTTKTGYYFRKGLNENFYQYKSGYYSTLSRVKIEFRFAELLLNYAEAMNEVYGPEGCDPDGELRVGPSCAVDALNLIRARVNMPLINKGLSKDELRNIIKHERCVELCFEGHRFFDLRRWKEGEKLGRQIHGIDITPTGFDSFNRPTGFKYNVVKVADRVWADNMYWWPIPHSEIVKYEGKLKQNKGW